MVYKAKRVSGIESRTYYTILMPDDDGEMVLWNRKNDWGGYLFTTSLMEAKRFPTKEHAINFISEELKGTENSSYTVIPLKVEVSIGGSSLNN